MKIKIIHIELLHFLLDTQNF